MKQSNCFSETFQNTKTQILKQKYEYMLNYLGEVERSTGELRRENEQLRTTLQQLNTKMSSHPDEREELEKEMMKYHEQQKQKMKRVEELKKLISQYKYLCQQSMKFQFPRAENSFGKDTIKSSAIQDSFRSNSFFQADSSQNQNSNNISISRNKSYQKIKTKIVCDNCQKQYKPNEYYRHYEDCYGTPLNQSTMISKSKGKQKPSKPVGYKTMRS